MSIEFNFKGKVALVTGGGSGIGRAAALAYAKAGASVSVVGRSAEKVEETVRFIEQAGGQAIAIECDVSDEVQVKAAVAKTIERFDRLDLAFNNAGIEQQKFVAHELSTDDWKHQLDVNLTGVFLCMKYQIPELLKQGGGAITNTSSGAGVKGFPASAAYCASKFGLIGLSKSAALDYAAQGIRVNVVAPGIIETPMMDRFSGGTEEGRNSVIGQEPVGRMGRPEEIAGTVLWLSSDLAAFTTGAVIVVDGGQTV